MVEKILDVVALMHSEEPVFPVANYLQAQAKIERAKVFEVERV